MHQLIYDNDAEPIHPYPPVEIFIFYVGGWNIHQTRNSMWEATTGVSFERGLKFHRALGVLTYLLSTTHMTVWWLKWAYDVCCDNRMCLHSIFWCSSLAWLMCAKVKLSYLPFISVTMHSRLNHSFCIFSV